MSKAEPCYCIRKALSAAECPECRVLVLGVGDYACRSNEATHASQERVGIELVEENKPTQRNPKNVRGL